MLLPLRVPLPGRRDPGAVTAMLVAWQVEAALAASRAFADADLGAAAAAVQAGTAAAHPEGFPIKQLLTLVDHARTEAARGDAEGRAAQDGGVSLPALLASLRDFGYGGE
jgi:hypothetical protein